MTTFLLATIFFVGCGGNYTGMYVASTNKSFISNIRDSEFDRLSKELIQNRVAFEEDLDNFYIRTLYLAEKEGNLDTDGIIYLNQKEAELREQMDAVEKQSIDNIDAYIRSFDEQIEKNDKYIVSILDSDKLMAERITQLSIQLNEKISVLQEDAAKRREIQFMRAQAKIREADNESARIKLEEEMFFAEFEEVETPEPVTPEGGL